MWNLYMCVVWRNLAVIIKHLNQSYLTTESWEKLLFVHFDQQEDIEFEAEDVWWKKEAVSLWRGY